MTNFSENQIISLASKYINQTNCNIFLTGKAGTGKTTFLKNITQYTYKNHIVAAPTGVAAINAGGVTLHSLFHLPFGAFIPSNNALVQDNYSVQINTPQSLLKDFNMNKTKRNLLREMDLLIIDEASMLRADLLDAIDTILRFVRKQKNKVFGGVQILFIGDLLQLPPVVKNNEKEYLAPYYKTPYFFDALALRESKLVYLELEKIYRQSDNRFINLLNNLRNNQVSHGDIELLNKYYQPGFQPDTKDGYINLTTHNQKADEINRQALKKIDAPSFFYYAEVSGDFNEYQFPVDQKLELKKGAQVMFIKNDYSGEGRYFNGKIGTVSHLNKDDIIVAFSDGSHPAEAERYTWENKKFNLNKETNEIEEKVAGVFSHFPLKLAWAITVHKSQGLTFEKAIIDVSKAFAPGQIYVALSRLTSLDGLVLTEPINTNALFQDENLSVFAENKEETTKLESSLPDMSSKFITDIALQAFNFHYLSNAIAYHLKSYDKDIKKSKKQAFKNWAIKLHVDFKPVFETSTKFNNQIRRIADEKQNNYLFILSERIQAATTYFNPRLKAFQDQITEHLEELVGVTKIKTYLNEIGELDRLIYSQLQKINRCLMLINAIINDVEITRDSIKKSPLYEERNSSLKKLTEKKAKEKKENKINTKEVSFKMYSEGKNIDEIAKTRVLSPRTIEGHLVHYVAEGKLKASQFVVTEKIDEIRHVAKKLNVNTLTPIKNELGDDFSFSEIKFALAGFEL